MNDVYEMNHMNCGNEMIIIATITETTFAERPEFLNSLNTFSIGTINNELAYDVDQIRLRRRVHQ